MGVGRQMGGGEDASCPGPTPAACRSFAAVCCERPHIPVLGPSPCLHPCCLSHRHRAFNYQEGELVRRACWEIRTSDSPGTQSTKINQNLIQKMQTDKRMRQ